MELAPNSITFGASLAGLTTYRLGGPAEVLVQPDNLEELGAVLAFVRQKGLPFFILGGGSNVLFKDGGFSGVVIRLGPGFARLMILGEEEGKVLVEAGAATPTAKLLGLTRREGLTGLEFLAGIPGWVGGALAMNAGSMGREIVEMVVELRIMEPAGEVNEVRGSDLNASYRQIGLPAGSIILNSVFGLTRSTPEEVEAEIKLNLKRRSASQPKGVRSAGCVFRNPPGQAAGWLIDQAGLKGRRIGSAWIAEEHANFIVHRGGATADQVLQLIETVKNEVRDKFMVDLETEIIIAGQDPEKKNHDF